MVPAARGLVTILAWLQLLAATEVTVGENTTRAGEVQAQEHRSPLIVANETVPVARARSLTSGQVVFPGGGSESTGRHSNHNSLHAVLYGTGQTERYTPPIPRSACQLYPDAGSCSGGVRAWYWDSSAEKCRTFTYGGCKGNDNNFITESECRAVCDIEYRQKKTGSSGFLPRPVSNSYDGSSYGPVSAAQSQYYPSSSYNSQSPSSSYNSQYPSSSYNSQSPSSSYNSQSTSSSYNSQSPSSSYNSQSKYPTETGFAVSKYYARPGAASVSEIHPVRPAFNSQVDLNGLSPASRPFFEAPRQQPLRCAEEEGFCALDDDDYPSAAVGSFADQYDGELRQMYQQLYQRAPEEYRQNGTAFSGRSRGQQWDGDAVQARHGAGEFVCESEVHYVRPGWARTAGAWNLVINTPAFPQAVRTERCRYEGRRCNYLPPCMSSVCVQRYVVVKLMCASPLSWLSPPRLRDVRIPSGCSCYVTGGSADVWREPWVRSDAQQRQQSADRD